jgi:hypothetical protein
MGLRDGLYVVFLDGRKKRKFKLVISLLRGGGHGAASSLDNSDGF